MAHPRSTGLADRGNRHACVQRRAVSRGGHPDYDRSLELCRSRCFKCAAHDDVLLPEFLGACVAALEKNTDAVLCQSDIDYIDDDGMGIGVRQSQLPGAGEARPSNRG